MFQRGITTPAAGSACGLPAVCGSPAPARGEKRARLLLYAGLSLGICFSASACSIKQRPCPVPDAAQVSVSFDWCEVPALPEGIRVVFFPLDALSEPKEFSMYAEGDEITLPCNTYSVLVYNVDVETVRFTAGSYLNAQARMIEASRPSAQPEGTAYGEPEMLYICAQERFEATPSSAGTLKLKFTPRCVVRECAFSIPMKGAEFVKDLRGSVTGMAPAINLSTGEPAGGASTIYFDRLVKTPDGIRGSFRYFGCCDPASKAMGMQTLVIELLRPDGVQKVEVNVSETLAAAAPGAAGQAPPLEIPHEIVVDYTPGENDPDNDFDVSVGDWDDEIFVPIPM